MNTLLEQDWRKVAAAATQSNDDIEKAFLDQAYMYIQNKATPIMKPPYRIGFEIVFKNDDNTRLVGVFVFRINQDHLFVPTFFINGNIKGTDLLYRANVKRFVPLDNDWCEYLLHLNTMDEGQGVSRRERQMVRDQLNLLDLVRPPSVYRQQHYKYAGVCDNADEVAKVDAQVTEMFGKISSVVNEPALNDTTLRRFITNDGGHSAIKKLANAARHDTEFARALMLGSKTDNYAPQLDAQPVKVASADPLVVVHTCVLRNKNAKKATAAEMCQGYKIDDFRKEAQVNEYVFADNTSEISTVQAPGVYNVLLADGTSRKMLVGYYREFASCCQSSPKATGYAEEYDPSCGGWNRNRFAIVDAESGASDMVSHHDQQWVFGDYIGKIADSDKLKDMDSAEKGECYRLYDLESQAFSDPFCVCRKEKDPSGLQALYVSDYNTECPRDIPLLINPDYRDYDAKDNIFGSRFKIVKVEAKKEEPYDKGKGKRLVFERNLGLGNKHSLNAFIFEHGFKKAAVRQLNNGSFIMKTERTGQTWTGELSKAAAKVKIMLDCAVREELAEDLVKQAEEKKNHEFFYDAGKIAHNVRFHDWPQFYDRMNSEFNVLEQPQTSYMMRTESDRPIIERHRVGDKWNQESGDSSIDTMTPLQLYEFSKNKGVGNLFELGVVGELIKTYDAAGFIQNYISDLEVGVDRLGRIIFLFYWKPEDFSQAYGSDDQSSLENKFLSSFKALGALTLELMQKSKLQQEGTVSLV